MARSSAAPRSFTEAPVQARTTQPHPAIRGHQYTESVASLPGESTALRPPSLERTFLCKDRRYPFARSKLPQPVRRASATPSATIHWRGNEHALFKLSPTAKHDIRDFILDGRVARNKEYNELKKPTGTMFVYVLQLDEDQDEEQEALCVLTNPTTLEGIYKFRDVAENENAAKESGTFIKTTSHMQNVVMYRLPRSRDATSFARMMAIANEEGFPLADRELDSDSEDSNDSEAPPPPPYITTFDVITEAEEKVEANDGFAHIVNYAAPKYCRDPHFAGHSECHGRYKTNSYGHSAVEAELDFQERFAAAHSGGDSVAHYRNWCVLKWDYGETLVHGRSALRNTVAANDDEDELIDPTERLIRMIDAKYGPLTRQGQSSSAPNRKAVKCSDECSFKINKFFDQSPEDDPWLATRPTVEEHEDAASEPSTLFVGVADLSDDDDPTPATSQSRTVPSISEEVLQKMLNTTHEEFIEHYVQRQQALREKAARAKHSSVEASLAPASSSPNTEPPAVISNIVSEEVESPSHVAVTLPEPATTVVDEVPPSILPVFASDEAAPIDIRIQPASVLTSHSSRDDLSTRTSVFSRGASVTTKPSNESFGSDYLRLVETLNLEAEVHPASVASSHDRRVTSMPILTLMTTDMCDTATEVSALNHIAPERRINTNPSTSAHPVNTVGNCLSPIVEVQTPVEPSLKQPADMYVSVSIDDRADSPPLRIESRQQDIISRPAGDRESQEQQPATILQPPRSPMINESHATRKRWGSKVKSSVKNRFQVVSGATKQGARRVVCSTKKLGARIRYLVPVATGARNPYETVALI